MATDPESKPHYLDLLHEIAPGEKRAGVFLKAWADKTPDPELKACLDLVARRETSHYHIFKRRIEELGYSLEEQEDPTSTRGSRSTALTGPTSRRYAMGKPGSSDSSNVRRGRKRSRRPLPTRLSTRSPAPCSSGSPMSKRTRAPGCGKNTPALRQRRIRRRSRRLDIDLAEETPVAMGHLCASL